MTSSQLDVSVALDNEQKTIGEKHNQYYYFAPAPRVGALSDDARVTSVCRVHRA